MSFRVRDFCKQLKNLGCRVTNVKGDDQTWKTPRGNAFSIKINRMGDDLSVGSLGNIMRVLKNDGFYLEDNELKASPEAYPEGFDINEVEHVSQEKHKHRHYKERKAKFTCILCNQSFDDLAQSTVVKKHLENCGKGIPSCRHCGKQIESPLGLQKHETYCPKQHEIK